MRDILSRREGLAWLAAFCLIMAALAAVRFTSSDPDSSLYAGLAARLSHEPVSRWIAPEWWNLWERLGNVGLYRSPDQAPGDGDRAAGKLDHEQVTPPLEGVQPIVDRNRRVDPEHRAVGRHPIHQIRHP